ncbi:MAG: HipA domain-containing protein [Clostridiales bacterium]|nr:HipA domain-containing protein [Clostridiales bacterium]
MNCLCCGKPLHSEQGGTGWHQTCIRRFFKTANLPELDMDEHTLELLAIESTNKGYTVPGVQKKLSLHFFSDGKNPRLTLLNYPAGYILKPQVEEFEALPEAEQLVMCMADRAGISTVPHALIRGDDQFAYITRRIDREATDGEMKMFAMEDFCQLDLRLTQDKYRGSYERCARVIHRYSSRSGLDMTELFMRLVFSFAVGNSDMHLKNFSLIETEENSGRYQLSPAYDLLPVNVIMPEDQDQFALTMNGKKRNLRRKDFLVFVQKCGIPQVSAEKMMAKILSMAGEFEKMCRESLLPPHLKDRFVNLMEERFRILREIE